MNKVILVGNLTKDPVLSQTTSNKHVARFTVAVRRRYGKDTQQQADFINCVAWNKTADFLCDYFHKGSGIQVCGWIQTRSWDDPDGKKQFATEVVADEIQFNGSKSNVEEAAPSSASTAFAAPVTQGNVAQISEDDFDFTDINYNEDDFPF